MINLGPRSGWTIVCWLLLAGAGFLAACSPSARESASEHPEQVHIVYAEGTNGNRAALMKKVLEETFPSAAWHGLDDFSVAEHMCLAEGQVMLIADIAAWPVRLWRPLEHYLHSGGRAVFWGNNPLREPEGTAGMGASSPIGWAGEIVPDHVREMAGRSSIQLWSSRAAAGEDVGVSRIVRPAGVPWNAVEVNLVAYRESNMLVSAEAELPEGDADAFCFFAFGDSNTTRLALLSDAGDGSLWRADEPLDSEWRFHVVPWSRFQREGGRNGDGGEQMKSSQRLAVGLNNAVAPQTPGPHVYGLSDVRVMNGVAGMMPSLPDIPMLVPSFCRAETETALIQSMLDDTQHAMNEPVAYDSPLPLRRWMSGDGARCMRVVPLYGGVDSISQEENGWAASVFTEDRGGRIGIWGWVGIPPDADNRRWMASLLSSCVEQVQRGVFLARTPEVPLVIEANGLLEVDVAWMAPPERIGGIRVAGELLAEDGRRLRRVTSPLVAAADMTLGRQTVRINMGLMPALQSGVQDYCLRIALEDVSAESVTYDESRHAIKVSGEQSVSSLPWLKCSGSRLVSERQAVYIMGIRYQPLDNLMLPDFPDGRWLESPWFLPERISADLMALSRMNVNAILVPYNETTQAEGLRCLIHEAGRHGIRVALEMKALSPWNPDLPKAESLIRAARLDSEPGVFAVFLSPETPAAPQQERAALDGAWREWLVEQYGSPARAEKMMGKPDWRRDGMLTGPSEQDLAGYEKHAVATIVYRRFMDDFMSRRYGWLKRFVRNLGCRQLLSVAACPLNEWRHYPGDFTAGSLHFDFLAPSASGCCGPDDSFMELGFLTAYGRGSRGVVKPIVWMDFGPAMGADPQEADLRNQERIFDAMFEMVNRSSAAGTFAACFSSARGPNQNDAGILSPLGEPRPVCMTFARHMRRLRNSMIYPATWKGRVFSRSANPTGLVGLFEEWRNTYAGELADNAGQELRPFGFGKSTADMPLLTLGGLPYADPSPFECANAEWGGIWVNGRPILRKPGTSVDAEWGDTLRLTLLNSGVAAWAASRPDQQKTVWVLVRTPSGREQRLPLPMVVPGGEESIEWTASESGTWTFRATILDVGDFGEALQIVVGRRGNPGR